MILAHGRGVPLEEPAPALAGAGIPLARASVIVRTRLHRRWAPGT